MSKKPKPKTETKKYKKVPHVLSPQESAALLLAQLQERVRSIVAHCGMAEDFLHEPINWEMVQTFVDEVNDDLAAMDQIASQNAPDPSESWDLRHPGSL